jgi:hypothetical protein
LFADILRDGCFSDCARLATVTFESECHVHSIQDLLFERCSMLSSICIPSSVVTLELCCFANCARLATVAFESGPGLSPIDDCPAPRGTLAQLRSLGTASFLECSSLLSIRIPSYVVYINPDCFRGCTGLSRVTFDSVSQLPWLDNRTFSRCFSLS